MSLINTAIMAVAIPFVLLLGALTLREALGSRHSASADMLLALVMFHSVVIIDAARFKGFVANPDIQDNLYAIFLFLIIVTMLCWVGLLVFAEPRIQNYQDRELVETLCQVKACTAKARVQEFSYPTAAKLLAFFLPLTLGGGTLSAFLFGK
jgi:hypothetical protein